MRQPREMDTILKERGWNLVITGAVFHINESSSAKQRAALRNIINLIAEMPDLPVELVVQGDAINLVVTTETELAEELRTLQDRGLSVAVCHNTMKAKNISAQQLLPNLTIVPSAVGRLVTRQQEGFSYIKP